MVVNFISPVISLLLAGLWVLWKAFRWFVIGSPLDNIPGPAPDSYVTGVVQRLFGDSGFDFHKAVLAKYGGVVKIKAFFGRTCLLVSDPKALHCILVKEQHTYEESDSTLINNNLAFGPGLLGSLGEQHRRQRKMLNPVFSIAHLREMIPTFYNVTRKLQGAIASKVKDGPQEIEILSWMTRTALELIGQSGFGYSFDDLADDSVPSPYAVSVKKFSPTIIKLFFVGTVLVPSLSKIGTAKFRRSMVELIPWRALQDFIEVVDTIYNSSVEVFESKKQALAGGDDALERQIAHGKDIMSILLRANMQADKENRLSEEELIAQMSTLTFAAMDSTSSALARVFWVLAQHQDAQNRLRLEIREARQGGNDLTYDQLDKLPYLDAICKETLRLYPPLPIVTRVALQGAILPVGTPVQCLDGREISEIPVPKGTEFMISIMGCNHNPEIWGPDASEWKPERWLQPLPDSVTAARIPGVYSNLMTFLGGGRACIGFKLFELEMKVVLSLLIESFKFSLSDKEIHWKTFGITTPTVVGDSSGSKLPIIIGRV